MAHNIKIMLTMSTNYLHSTITIQQMGLIGFKKCNIRCGLSRNSIKKKICIWMILMLSDVHSCVIRNENLLLQFIKSLQPSEGSRTDELINLQPADVTNVETECDAITQCSTVTHGRSQCLPSFNYMRTTSGHYKTTTHTCIHIRSVNYNDILCGFFSAHWLCKSLSPFQDKHNVDVLFLIIIMLQMLMCHITYDTMLSI